MSEIDKTRKRRAYFKGTITSNLNRLDRLLKPEGASPTLDGKLALTLINDVESALDSVNELSELICLELKETEMQEDISKTSDYVFEIRTKIYELKELLPKNSCKIVKEGEALVKLPLPTINLVF